MPFFRFLRLMVETAVSAVCKKIGESAHGAEKRALSDTQSGRKAACRQYADGGQRQAAAEPDAVDARAGADLLAEHDGHAAGGGVRRLAGRGNLRRDPLRQGGARVAAAHPGAGRRRAVHRRHAGAELGEGAQHPAADLRAAGDGELPAADAGHRRPALHQVGAAQRRRRDRRRARHDGAGARHDRHLRLRLPVQLVLPARLPPLHRRADAHAGDLHGAARPAVREGDPDQAAEPAEGRCRLHEPAGRRHHPRAAQGRRRAGDQRPAQLHAGGRRQADRREPVGREHPLPDQHLPDRRPRDDVGAAVLHALFPGQQSGRAGQGL